MSDEAMGDDVYQPASSEVEDEEALLDTQDSLDPREPADALEQGYSPPEKPMAVEHTGVTAAEQREGESLDERLALEEPDFGEGRPEGDGIGDVQGTDGEPVDEEAGADRAGRLMAPDEGAHADEEKDMVAADVGVDGAAASAEEAAVHRVDEETEEP